MEDVRVLEETLRELQEKLEKEVKIRDGAEQILLLSEDKTKKSKVKKEIERSTKWIQVYSDYLDRVKSTLSNTEIGMNTQGTFEMRK
jgi:hypothetical protein